MKTKYLSVAVGLLLVVALIAAATGCQRGATTSTVVVPQRGLDPVTAADLPIELTYPQSDDQGHYVGLKKDGSYVVSGVVASPQPPQRVLVNGISTVPYRVEQITPYGMTTSDPVYRFYAPALLTPTERIAVQVVEPVVSREVVFTPDGPAVVTRYTTLVAAAPTDPYAATRLGSAYYAQSAFTDSTQHLNQALSGNQSTSGLLYQLGMAYLSLRQSDRALDSFNRGISADPNSPDLYYGQGLTYYTTQRYDDAIVSLARASKLAPNWAEPLLALGQSYYADRRLADAQEAYSRTASISPYWPAPRYALANVLIDRGDLKSGLAQLEQAERLGPWRYEHHMALARKLYAKGNTNAAWRQVQIARKLGGQVPPAFLKQLSSKSKDPGDLGEEPWKAMRGPGKKPEVKPAHGVGGPEGGPGKGKPEGGPGAGGQGQGKSDSAGQGQGKSGSAGQGQKGKSDSAGHGQGKSDSAGQGQKGKSDSAGQGQGKGRR
jgi:tetratricopeptide (TPR) repeat protein